MPMFRAPALSAARHRGAWMMPGRRPRSDLKLRMDSKILRWFLACALHIATGTNKVVGVFHWCEKM